MTRTTIGKWGRHLALALPPDVADRLGVVDGGTVDVAAVDDCLVIRRIASPEQMERATTAVEAIIADRPKYPLGDVTIRELIDEGRRG